MLTLDAATAALSFQPVLAATRKSPPPTVRVELDDDEVLVTTGVHQFWRGVGWTMARELKPGDALRTASGVRGCANPTLDDVRPVYNLDVANHDYFVGTTGALAHDSTPSPPTPRPFDAVPEPVPARRKPTRGE